MIRLTHLVALATVCLALYLPGLSGPFLFDSYIALPGNPALDLEGSVFDQWRVAALSSASGPLGRPVSMLSFALNQVLFSDSAAAVKTGNLLLHVFIGFWIYHFLQQLLQLSPATTLQPARAKALAFASV